MKRWPTKPLGKLCDVRIGRTPRRDEPRFWGGDAVWVTIRELNGGEITSSKEMVSAAAVRECMPEPVPTGTLLFSFKLSIGKMAVAGCPLYTNEAIAALPVLNPAEFSRDFLRYALLRESHEGTANTAVMGKVLNKEKVQQLAIPVPPLAEQERIVKLLDEADELRKLRAQADRRTAALIPALFHEMFGEPRTNRRRFPLVELGSLCKSLGGGTPSKNETSYWIGKIPWVSPKDMAGDEVHDSEDHISERAVKESATNLIPAGAILIVTRSGILKHTLPVAVNSLPVTINQDIKAFIPVDGCTATFLAAQLRLLTPTILASVRVGATVQNIETNALKRLSVLNPPLALQKEFAARVAEIRALQAAQAASRRRLEELFQSLLHRAFNGEL